MSDLTLPGTIPKLLRRCSPVIKDGWTGGAVVAKVRDLSVVVVSEDGPSWPFAQPASLRLDLTDATGRDHAAKWLADRLAPNDGPYTTAAVMPGSWFGPVLFGLLTVSVNYGARMLRCGDPSPFECTDDLDPNNDRRLPDGSRWVDAEALRRVVLHVAGVPA